MGQEYYEVAKRSSKLDLLKQQKEPKVPFGNLGFFSLLCNRGLTANSCGGRGSSWSLLCPRDADTSGENHFDDVGAAPSVILAGLLPSIWFMRPFVRSSGLVSIQE